ncbi:uncharacterized protein LOC127749751 [Frankliniella occidentalis]|uniref:Uncharacterized protein LOC127749751 n=1 Tax=Frankliniella occidentalis TaxID=133901 RepID=A0A9C6UC62_FRAOC|nr:uncharacterized protein LOC127749751 [Frankliniella occidentalis]
MSSCGVAVQQERTRITTQARRPTQERGLRMAYGGIPDFALVRPEVRRSGDPEGRRRRRGAEDDDDGVLLRAEAMGRNFNLRLRRSAAVLDPYFALLRRDSNHSQHLDAGLVDQEERCLYRGEGSDGESVAAHISDGMAVSALL